jgi:hypothetical protein
MLLSVVYGCGTYMGVPVGQPSRDGYQGLGSRWSIKVSEGNSFQVFYDQNKNGIFDQALDQRLTGTFVK